MLDSVSATDGGKTGAGSGRGWRGQRRVGVGAAGAPGAGSRAEGGDGGTGCPRTAAPGTRGRRNRVPEDELGGGEGLPLFLDTYRKCAPPTGRTDGGRRVS